MAVQRRGTAARCKRPGAWRRGVVPVAQHIHCCGSCRGRRALQLRALPKEQQRERQVASPQQVALQRHQAHQAEQQQVGGVADLAWDKELLAP
jgi:hypothetical protein